MTKTKLFLIIPLLLILTLSACSFKSKKDDDNKEKVDKETYIIKYALNKEDVKERLNSLPGLGNFNSEDDINVFELNCKKLASLNDYVYFYFTELVELADFQMTKLDGNLVEYFQLEEGLGIISGGWLPGDSGWQKYPEYSYNSYYQIKNGPIYLLSGKGSGELNEDEVEALKEDLRFLANIFYLALKYPDFSIVDLAYSYDGENYYYYDCWKNIISEISMDCKLDSDCVFISGYHDSLKVIPIAKNNNENILNEFISKIEVYNLHFDFPENYTEHLKPICKKNICSLGLIIDVSDENYLLNIYNNVFNETIVKSISYDNFEERYNFFVWLNSKDDYIKGRIYPEDNIDLNGYEIKYLNNKVEYSQFKEEVEIMVECIGGEHRAYGEQGACVERERYHYNFSVYYKLENDFLFEFTGDGRGNLKDLDKDEFLEELRFIIDLLELPLKHKDFKYTDFAISYNGEDYYFLDFYRREFSNLSMNCQTDNDCWVFPYYCDIMPYIPLSSYSKRGDIKNLREKVEHFNNNFSGKCIELPENYFASQCLKKVCTLTRGEGQTSNTKNNLHLKPE